MRGSIALVSVVAVLVTVGAACADDGEPPAAPRPGDPTGTAPAPGPTPPEPSPLEVGPREGLVEVRPRPWEDVEVTSPRTLRVLFWSGVEECYGLDRVEVEETRDTVAIILFEGRVPEAEVCIEVAVAKVVEVRLDEPLGDREIVDGAPEDG